MILGEAEIQGQVKRAYELALVEGATGPILNRLFRGALATGKRVRTETRIGEGGISIPSVAVELAQRSLGGKLASRRVLLIGAGETAELTAQGARGASGVEAVFVANRRYDRAIGLAERFGGEAVRFDELPEPAGRGRHRRLLDQLAPPHRRARGARADDGRARGQARCCSSTSPCRATSTRPAARSTGVAIHDVDDVQSIVDRNFGGREAEARRAERIVDAELCRFERWLGSLEVLPTVAALREHADAIVEQILAENENRWERPRRRGPRADRGDGAGDREPDPARADAAPEARRPTTTTPTCRSRTVRKLFGLDATTEPEGRSAEVTPIRREDRGGA